jgi:hypothetical protein
MSKEIKRERTDCGFQFGAATVECLRSQVGIRRSCSASHGRAGPARRSDAFELRLQHRTARSRVGADRR